MLCFDGWMRPLSENANSANSCPLFCYASFDLPAASASSPSFTTYFSVGLGSIIYEELTRSRRNFFFRSSANILFTGYNHQFRNCEIELYTNLWPIFTILVCLIFEKKKIWLVKNSWKIPDPWFRNWLLCLVTQKYIVVRYSINQ